MPGYLGRFVDSLGNFCEQVTCFMHSPQPDGTASMDYKVSAPNVKLVNIGPHTSVLQRSILASTFTRPILDCTNKLDVCLIRGPSPLLPAVARAVGQTPLVLLLVGDYMAGVSDSSRPGWRKELIRLWSRWYQWQQTQVARRSLTFVNSRKLYLELQPSVPNLVETRTTTLSSNDFFERLDTCLSAPYRLLYTGRIDRAKGLLEMVEALALLVGQGENVRLDLVGWPEKNDPIMKEIDALAQMRGITDKVHYHGYRPVGPELFAYYRQADLYVIASKSNFEGFPRTIWEAMAHSLPVVATKVGSIPHFTQGIAALVEPGNAVELAAAISRLIHTPALRQDMIQKGMQLARQNTLENQVGQMVGRIGEWVQKHNAKTSPLAAL